MKAFVLHDINKFCLETIPDPIPKVNEVIVSVKASGICGSDVSRVYKTGTYSYPLIPGHEFSGEVVEVGADVKKTWLKRKVGVFPLIPCHNCPPCLKKQYEMCRLYSYLGSRQDGGFAEYVAVPVDNLISLSENVSYEQAAMMEPMAVAVHAIRRAVSVHEKQGTVAIYGLGTIGMLLLSFLQEAGIENIFVIGNKDVQKQMVLNLGIPEGHYFDIREQGINDFLINKTEGKGVDTFFECVGKNDTVERVICNTAPGGKVILVGNPYTDMKIEQSIYWRILRNQLTVIGTWNSTFLHKKDDDWHYVMSRLGKGCIHPEDFISHRFTFNDLKQGLHIMHDKTEDYLKVMVRI